MDLLATGLVLGREDTMSAARSALPDAPVVAFAERRRGARVDVVALLRRLARVVAALVQGTPIPALGAAPANGVGPWDESRCRRLPNASA